MSLPELKFPEYEVELPITKKVVKFRPYSISEEKLLILAKEESPKQYFDAIRKIVTDCLLNGDIPEYLIDFIYLFTNIRAKSKGEVIEGFIHCEKCKNQTPVNINILDSLGQRNIENKNKVVTLDKELSVELSATKSDILFSDINPNNLENIIENVVAYSISKIILNKKIYKDFTVEELKEKILNKLTYAMSSKLIENTSHLPQLYFKYTINCINCGHKEEVEEADFSAFFEF